MNNNANENKKLWGKKAVVYYSWQIPWPITLAIYFKIIEKTSTVKLW